MDTVKQMQLLELGIFREFKRLCDKNGLRYFAIGGTCLGAVRHQGFVPWDDDMDLVMPNEDYIRFCEIAEEQLQPPYALYAIKGHPHWCGNFVKVVNENTTLVEKGCQRYRDRYTGVYIDIMPMYGTSGNPLIRHLQALQCGMYNHLNNCQRLDFTSKKRLRYRLFWILNTPIRTAFSCDYYTDRLAHSLGKRRTDNSNEVMFGWRTYRSLLGRYTYRNLFYYSDFAEGIEVPFEDTVMMIPKGYDRYLRMDFDDYMTLPPPESRVSDHPTDIFDLNCSYKKYRKERFGE